MKFLVDAQLPPALCDWLKARGHDAIPVADAISGQSPDSQIAAFAVAHARIVITKDDDFQSRHSQPGLTIVWLRIGNASNRALAKWLEARWDAIVATLADGDALVEVV